MSTNDLKLLSRKKRENGKTTKQSSHYFRKPYISMSVNKRPNIGTIHFFTEIDKELNLYTNSTSLNKLKFEGQNLTYKQLFELFNKHKRTVTKIYQRIKNIIRYLYRVPVTHYIDYKKGIEPIFPFNYDEMEKQVGEFLENCRIEQYKSWCWSNDYGTIPQVKYTDACVVYEIEINNNSISFGTHHKDTYRVSHEKNFRIKNRKRSKVESLEQLDDYYCVEDKNDILYKVYCIDKDEKEHINSLELSINIKKEKKDFLTEYSHMVYDLPNNEFFNDPDKIILPIEIYDNSDWWNSFLVNDNIVESVSEPDMINNYNNKTITTDINLLDYDLNFPKL